MFLLHPCIPRNLLFSSSSFNYNHRFPIPYHPPLLSLAPLLPYKYLPHFQIKFLIRGRICHTFTARILCEAARHLYPSACSDSLILQKLKIDNSWLHSFMFVMKLCSRNCILCINFIFLISPLFNLWNNPFSFFFASPVRAGQRTTICRSWLSLRGTFLLLQSHGGYFKAMPLICLSSKGLIDRRDLLSLKDFFFPLFNDRHEAWVVIWWIAACLPMEALKRLTLALVDGHARCGSEIGGLQDSQN